MEKHKIRGVKMENPLLLYEVAKLHHRDVDKKVSLRQESGQAKTSKISIPGLVKRFVMVAFSPKQNRSAGKMGEVFSP